VVWPGREDVLRAKKNKWLKLVVFCYFGRKGCGKGVNIVKKEKNAVERCFVGGRIMEQRKQNSGDRIEKIGF